MTRYFQIGILKVSEKVTSTHSISELLLIGDVQNVQNLT